MTSEAILSTDQRYRYSLIRRWSEKPLLVFCMLNPSTADADKDDPTIRKCVGFARREGYGGIYVVNLFAWRATDPLECLIHIDLSIGSENDEHLRKASAINNCVVCAWGSKAPKHIVEHAVDQFTIARLYCLGLTKDGNPRHPLYVSYEQPLGEWRLDMLHRRYDD